MKVNESSRPAPTQKIERAGKASGAESARATAPVDDISLLGVPDAELTPKVRAALLSLVEDIRTLREELDQTRARISELETLADRDPMFDVFNRRAFAREMDRALAMIDRYGVRVSLVFIDLNDLKKINDTMGHGAGDAALAHIAEILSANVRQTDIVARLGGDEFALLLMQADQAVAQVKAQQVAELIAEKDVIWDGAPFKAAVSWGAVEIKQGLSAKEAMTLADEAMYEAKRAK